MPSGSDWSEICYKARYPDIRTGYIYAGTDGVWYYQSNLVKGHVKQTKKLSDNAFWHWQNFGMPEGRVCGCDLPGTNYSNEFSSDAYLARYPDVRVSSAWHANPQGHYQKYGIAEGRHPGFEILTSSSPVGMTSPGTTTTVPDTTQIQSPGDGTVLLNPSDPLSGGTGNVTIDPTTGLPVDATTGQPVTIDPVTGLPVTTSTAAPTGSISDWITANPLPFAIGVGALLLLFTHKKKRA